MIERFLERIGLVEHKYTVEEINKGQETLGVLTADYLKGNINLETYNIEIDKLPKINFRQLVKELNFKG